MAQSTPVRLQDFAYEMANSAPVRMQDLADALNKATNAVPFLKYPPLPPDPQPGQTPKFPNQIPPLPDSNPVDAWKWDFATIEAFKKAQAAKSEAYTGKAWMASESKWKNRVGKGWKPVRVLGRGGQGVVGYWTYEGPDRDKKTLKDVAVKQAVKAGPTYRWGDGLEKESQLLHLLQKANTPHIVRMYRQLYEEVGQQTDEFDHGIVHRIFLEYCPGGDLHDWLGKWMNQNKPIPEYELWCVFQCLARACMVLDRGSEDLARQAWVGTEIVHFDLKLENVLVGATLDDTEHRNTPSYKMSDFGLATAVPRIQSPFWMDSVSNTGTVPWYLPEQVSAMNHAALSRYFPNERPWLSAFSRSVPGRQFGTPSNIWQVGLIMHVLMRQPHNRSPNWGGLRENDPDKLQCYTSNMTTRLQTGGNTIGASQDLEAEKNPQRSMYSKGLRSLIAECLLINPSKRVPVGELVVRSANHIDAIRIANGTNIGTHAPYQEPQLSQQWYSNKVNGNPANAPQNQPGGFPLAPLFPQPPAAAPQDQQAGWSFTPVFPGQAPPAPRPAFAQINPAAPAFNPAAAQFVPGRRLNAVAPAFTPMVAPAPVIQSINPAPFVPIGNNPGPNPGPGGPLWPVPNPLTVIMLRRSKLYGMMGGHQITYQLKDLTPITRVRDVMDELIKLGVNTTMVLRNEAGKAMQPNMMLGEFQIVQNIRGTEL
ncbi:kinase-like protein [Mollisia scopiformis]|uniref:Kinase-like protein n=1 Tax=Mollisia scopiformis TaxID=149040 RepID=A0A194XFW0_MOLSC|nr:kinase-like protein [Mollisia scopiformis]KUJ19058.1 kinase-like protein [Mollisia scopiformis]